MIDDEVLRFLSDLGDLVSQISYRAYKHGTGSPEDIIDLEAFEAVSETILKFKQSNVEAKEAPNAK